MIDFILEMATVQDKTVTPEELAHDPDEDAKTEDPASGEKDTDD